MLKGARISLSDFGPNTATALIALTAVCFGLVPLFAKELQGQGVGSAAIALYRYIFSAVLLSPFLPLSKGKLRQAGLMTVTGVFLGLGWIGYLEAVKTVPVAAAGVIYMTYPLFVLLFAWIMVGMKPSKNSLMAGGLIVAAAACVADPTVLTADMSAALMMAWTAPLGFGLLVVVLTTMVDKLSAMERMATGMLGATIGLAPSAIMSEGMGIIPTDWSMLALIAALGLITSVLPQVIYTVACIRVGPSRAAVAGSLELPTMFVIGFLAFGEALGPRELIAAALVLTAVFLVQSPKPAAGRTEPQQMPAAAP
ncbi:DMT family transporter [Pseudovibrio exalbescens]|uniref:DMT family transporter n=1 Tax=Pseudovibrio exalbescens TaxID=197461 RepID=UPI0023650484|nr:DMT family transporter [Pseudovibrio exalbescens]MDD7912178.1 DMT family transporter [Pseudovibrio exalbescens]